MPGSGWTLHVKGKDNEKAIARLPARPGSPPSIFDHVVASGDTNKELQAIRDLVPDRAGKGLGFVLDANGGPGTTRHSAVARLGRSAWRCQRAIPAGDVARWIAKPADQLRCALSTACAPACLAPVRLTARRTRRQRSLQF